MFSPFESSFFRLGLLTSTLVQIKIDEKLSAAVLTFESSVAKIFSSPALDVLDTVDDDGSP